MDYCQLFWDSTVKRGQTVCLTAKGLSMWPVIRSGMKAEISPVNLPLLRKGSLLLIKNQAGAVVHRYWGVRYEDGIPLVLTKGDTNIGFDPPVTMDRILGQVTMLYKTDGKRDPERGFYRLFGRGICLSTCLASLWARVCRFVLKRRYGPKYL